jgi:surface protein
LTTLNISSFDTKNVTNMGNMFYECEKLKELNLSNFNTSEVTTMNGMFYNCFSLTKLNLTSFDTKKVTDVSFIFIGLNKDCEVLHNSQENIEKMLKNR